jgi:SAM-dependent methyltransferase
MSRSSRFSPFSSVDASLDPAALVAYLDTTAEGLVAMKRYVAAAVGRAVPGGLVVDVGCGAGHDLALLARAGLRPVGIEPSATMLAAVATSAPAAPLVRGDGRALPLRSAAVDGCRIERVLQHVADPDRVVAEAARVLRPGGVLAVFEPDWASLAFGAAAVAADPRSTSPTDAADDVAVARALVAVRSPDVGERLVALAEANGLCVVDRVVEESFGHAIADHPLRLDTALAAAVDGGRIEADRAAGWWERQRALDDAGRFRASWNKVLVVAHRR